MPETCRITRALLLVVAMCAPKMARAQVAASPPGEETDWTLEWQDVYETRFVSTATLQLTIYPTRVLAINYSSRGASIVSDRAVHEWSDGMILLAACDSDDVEFGLLNDRLYLVRWGDREYAVPDSQMADFVEQIRTRKGSIAHVPAERPPPGTRLDNSARSETNLGPRFLWVPVRASDMQRNAFGTPELPEGWRAFLDHEPVAASIASVSAVPIVNADTPSLSSQFDVSIDKGTDDHVFVGQELFWRGLMGRVVSVEQTSAVVRFDIPRAGVPHRVGPGEIPAIGDTVAALEAATVKHIELPRRQ